MSLVVKYEDKELELTKSTTVKRMLERMDIPPETVFVVVNGQVVTQDERVGPGNDVQIIKVISGG